MQKKVHNVEKSKKNEKKRDNGDKIGADQGEIINFDKGFNPSEQLGPRWASGQWAGRDPEGLTGLGHGPGLYNQSKIVRF